MLHSTTCIAKQVDDVLMQNTLKQVPTLCIHTMLACFLSVLIVHYFTKVLSLKSIRTTYIYAQSCAGTRITKNKLLTLLAFLLLEKLRCITIFAFQQLIDSSKIKFQALLYPLKSGSNITNSIYHYSNRVILNTPMEVNIKSARW